ncbi:GerMN domain-containing protein [Geodermatophilus sp. SYSU D00758]
MRVLIAVLVLLVLAAAGCGVPAQQRPEPVEVPTPTRTSTGVPTVGGASVQLWFVRGARLEPVFRRSAPADLHAALDLLAAGPTPSEAADGLRTALAPQTLRPAEEGGLVDGVLTLSASRAFTDVAGGDQLLAVAQVVWTVTGFPRVEAVRVVVDGVPLEVPTDGGLTVEPVDRGDYRSVGPPATATPTGTPG